MIPRIRMVQIKNYKSLADVSIELGPFTVLVGPNGSGKSNFVDALSFVQECLNESVEHVLAARDGYGTIPYRKGDHPPGQVRPAGLTMGMNRNERLTE